MSNLKSHQVFATAVDNIDGPLPVTTIITDVSGNSITTIDTSFPAEYTITYTATDAAGNTATLVRTLRVRDNVHIQRLITKVM